MTHHVTPPMSRQMDDAVRDDSLQRSRRIDQLCSDFEAAWNSGDPKPIELILSQVQAGDRSALLADLVALEFELRISAGQSPEIGEYQKRFPDDGDAVTAGVALALGSAPSNNASDPRQLFKTVVTEQRYRLGHQVGLGGMGIVFRAHDRQLNRDLAIKILAERLEARREAIDRFLREARICAQLQHPGITPIHEMGWIGNRPYFAMKLISGQSLAERLKILSDRKSDLAGLLEVFERVCETVAYAHARGVVHRDLKPSNVMVGSFGEVYVIDWGLAKWVRASDSIASDGDDERDDSPERSEERQKEELSGIDTADAEPNQRDRSFAWTFLGDVLGTPHYMAPEQARGDTEAIDQRTDVFALGSILCELLTGMPPYSSDANRDSTQEPTSTLQQARDGNLSETISRLEACDADPELIALTRDCLATAPADRPGNAGIVLQRLTDFLRGVQDRLRRLELERVEALTRAKERRRRRRSFLTMAFSLLLLLALLTGGTAWVAQREAMRQRKELTRREDANRSLTGTLDELAALYDEAADDLRRDPMRRTRIRELAGRAETLAANALVDSRLVQRVGKLRQRLSEEDADERLLDNLEAVRLERAKVNPRTGNFATGPTRPLYRHAFNAYELDLENVSPEVAIAKIRGRPEHVVEACVFGLEVWRSMFRNPVPQRQWIDAVLEGIDDNPWRIQMRQACRESDWQTVATLIQDAKAHSLSVDVIHAVTENLTHFGQFDLALQLLEATQPDHPGDFWINQNLALAHYSRADPKLEESIRYATAAAAIRQTDTTYFLMGMALLDLQRYLEAEQAFRAAIGLQPEYALAHVYLAQSLHAQNRLEEALQSLDRALEVAADLPAAIALRNAWLGETKDAPETKEAAADTGNRSGP